MSGFLPMLGALILLAIALDVGRFPGLQEQLSRLRRGVPRWIVSYGGLTLVGLAIHVSAALTANPLLRVLWFPLVLIGFAWWFAELAARAGWIDLASACGYVSVHAMRQDREGGQWFAAALALARRARHHEPAAARITLALTQERRPLRGAGLTALGLVAASRGAREEARDLLRSVEHLPRSLVPDAALSAARSWRAADAAARGDWAEVARLGAADGPRGREVAALHRRALRVLASCPALEPGPPPAPPLEPAGRTALQRAAALHARAIVRRRLSEEELLAVGRAWEEALCDPETERGLLRRELALGASGESRARGRLRDRVRGELAWLLGQTELPLDGLAAATGVLADAAAEVRGELLAELDAQAEALQGAGGLPAIEQWRALARLREAYARAVQRLPGDRRLAYHAAAPALDWTAVHLFNVAGERSLAHATFLFLAGEAEAAGEGAAEARNRENARCGW